MNFGVDVRANVPQRQRKHRPQKNYYFDIAAANTYLGGNDFSDNELLKPKLVS